MRGKGTVLSLILTPKRITPAYAGKSPRASCRSCRGWDHPRVCGEKISCRYTPKVSMGSPPRMRGKVLAAGLHDLVDGITPAYAGKSRIESSGTTGRKDHPRVCGEKHRAEPHPAKAARITPAYAGKRPRPAPPAPAVQDHPRVCGEKLKPVRELLAGARTTPAHAGKRKCLK